MNDLDQTFKKDLTWVFKEKGSKINLTKNEQMLVEYNDRKKKTLGGDYVKKDKILSEFEKRCQQSEQKFLTFSELNQISGFSSSNTSPKHWEKYGKYYIESGIGFVIISLGAFVYYLRAHHKKEK